ncbi:hypothetical protein [Kribbella sp. DT2]|uniref:hypothetical protein n=1 Tax=Kribbella sp. DT2 TaxID=3393427 RepID=UPI003CF5EB27
MNDPAETMVTQSLETHAGEAPTDEALLGTVHRRLRRRRRARTAGVAVLAGAAVAVVATGIHSLTRPDAPGPTATSAQGWHWESFANVEVQVPDAWKEIGSSHHTTCVDSKAPSSGWVGRPTMLPVFLNACGEVPALANRVPYLRFDFNAKPGVTQYEAGWTREIRAVGALQVEVFGTDAAVRARVLDSARTIDGVDSRGCAPSHPAATDAGARPTGEGLAAVGAAESIRICAYRIQQMSRTPPLLASAELTGDQAREVGAALRAAPPPSFGPSNGEPEATDGTLCRPSDEEVFVLQVHGDRGDQEVVVRLTGCGPYDTDDGRQLRTPTKQSIGPLVTAVGRPESRGPFLTNLLK